MYSVLHKPQLLLLITTATRPFLMVWNPPRALIVFHVHFNTNYAVMQLCKITFFVGTGGFEPPTPTLSVWCSDQLSYVPWRCIVLRSYPGCNTHIKPSLDFIQKSLEDINFKVLLGGQDSNLHYGHPKH